MMAPTELDVFSCALDGATLIEASAGTGKTWNICGLYLRLLLERELSVQQILVVTFTKAATAELRQRIRERVVETLAALDGASASADPFVSQLLQNLTGEHRKTAQRLHELLNLALQSFDEAAIFTIHGFCQRALAETPFASQMPFATELVTDDSAYLLQAVHDFWRQHIGNDTPTTPLPAELVSYLLDHGDTPQRLVKLLRRHVAKPRAQYRWPAPAAMADAAAQGARLFDSAKTLWQQHEAAIRALLAQAQDDLKATHAPEKVALALADCSTFFSAAEARPIAASLRGVPMKLLRQSALNASVKSKRAAPVHPFFSLLDTLLEDLPGLQRAAADALQIARLQLIRMLLEDAAPRLRQQKRTLRVASYDDLLFNLAQAVTADTAYGAGPRLASWLRARYPAALIDEFQDTDPLQWEIFNAIYGNGEAPVFLVGDPKQAIYSFRNADLHTYLQAKQQTGSSHTLAANQRASASLIAGLNALFGANPAAFMLPGLNYQPVRCGSKPRTVLHDRSAASGASADLQLWMLPGDDNAAIERGAARRAAIDASAAEIARLLRAAQDGQITLGERALQPGDIAILVRSHTQGSDMRRALGAVGIGSVELAQASVFDSSDAADLESVLSAILQPARSGLLLAALATPLLGRDAAAIAAIGADDRQLLQQLEQFSQYHELWLRRGIGFMLRQLFSEQAVNRRMLCRPDGERRLTNLLHLIELLQQAGTQHNTPDTLLRWLQGRRRSKAGNGNDEAAQLRLESDRNLVQIVTIHKAKGLEYPIVFCPFLWLPGPNHGGIEGLEYHTDDGASVIDFSLDDATAGPARQMIKLEHAAEDLRLMYVALTRAAQRCYLVAGSYARRYKGTLSVTEGTRTLLNWLVAGAGQTPQQWLTEKQDLASINRAWRQLAQQAAPHIGMSLLQPAAATPVRLVLAAADTLCTPPPPAPLAADWRSSSFSGLTRDSLAGSAGGAAGSGSGERSASDHDAYSAAAPTADDVAGIDGVSSVPDVPHVPARDDILRFPRGAAAGDCLHAVLEAVEFDQPASWPAAITRALRRHPQPLPAAEREHALVAASHAAMIRRMLTDVLATPLPDGLQLQSVTRQRRLSELEFRLPAHHLQASALNQLLRQHGYQMPELGFRELDGYLNGFIDLVFEHRQRFYLLDWKSNYLGTGMHDYGPTALAAAMNEHRYHLQYLLYAVALQRYLQQRFPAYEYERHFGGVLYLFVRGVRPDWILADGSQAGVFFERPSAAILAALERLIAPANAQEPA